MPDVEDRPGVFARGTADGEIGSFSALQGVLVTAGTSAHAKGNWSELLSSTSKKVVGLTICLTNVSATARFLVDIGTGGSGSESVLIPNLFSDCQTSVAHAMAVIFVPVNIPQGTRIAARCQCSTANWQIYVALWATEVD